MNCISTTEQNFSVPVKIIFALSNSICKLCAISLIRLSSLSVETRRESGNLHASFTKWYEWTHHVNEKPTRIFDEHEDTQIKLIRYWIFSSIINMRRPRYCLTMSREQCADLLVQFIVCWSQSVKLQLSQQAFICVRIRTTYRLSSIACLLSPHNFVIILCAIYLAVQTDYRLD